MFDSWIKGFLIQFLFVCVGMLLIIMYPTIHNLVAAFLILNKEGMKAQSYSLFLEEFGISCFITQYVKRFFSRVRICKICATQSSFWEEMGNASTGRRYAGMVRAQIITYLLLK